jgi:predicted ATPase
LQYAEQAVSLATEQEFSLWAAYGVIMRGWALGQHGDFVDGIAQIQHGLAITRATGAELVHSWFLLMLAETYEKASQVADGLATVAKALDGVQQRGEQAFAAELYRMKGELTLAAGMQRAGSKEQGAKGKEQGARSNEQKSEGPDPQSQILDPHGEAEACFLKAIEIAQKQQAKSLELRATMSLARLWQQQDKQAEARQMLAEIYGWFTEGFDTKELQEAKALLDELSEGG